MKILKIRNMRKWKYVIRDEEYDSSDQYGLTEPMVVKSAYTPEGNYIGDTKMAVMLCKKLGIHPQLANPMHKVCSIGFSERDGKWYGWSHRAIYGFKIGSTCKRGDCHYLPSSKEDFALEEKNFWMTIGNRENVTVREGYENGKFGIRIEWIFSESIPNEKMRGKISGVFSEYPESFGRGEWVAKTMEDARQMAIDFANAVS